MDSEVESGDMTNLPINRIFRRRNKLKNTLEINPKN